MKRWRRPRNGHFYRYCCDCAHWKHLRDVGCARLGICNAVEGEPTEQDAYDKPCGLWKERRT